MTFKILLWGGLGDILLLTPAFKAIKHRYPHSKIKVLTSWQNKLELLKGNPYVDERIRLRFRSAPVDWLRLKVASELWDRVPSSYILPLWWRHGSFGLDVGHASKTAGEILGVEITDPTPEVFLTGAEETAAQRFMSQYRSPVVIQVNASCSPNKNWFKERWETLVRRNPQYTFIQLGTGAEERIEGAVDMLGRTSPRESVALVKYATSFVGVDSFLAHAAGAVGTPGVVLWGPTPPRVLAHASNLAVMGESLRCAPCLDRLHDTPCPYGRACMWGISVEQVERTLIAQAAAKRSGRHLPLK